MRSSPFDKPDPPPDFVRPQNVVEVRSVHDAMKLLAEWQAAYDELRSEYAKLHALYVKVKFRAECLDTLAKNEEMLRRHGVAEEATKT